MKIFHRVKKFPGSIFFLYFNLFPKYVNKTLQNALKSVFMKNIFFTFLKQHGQVNKSQNIIFSKTPKNLVKQSKNLILSVFEKNNFLKFFQNGEGSIIKKITLAK